MSLGRIWLFTALVWGQSAPKSLPGWLAPYPGAEVKFSSTANILNAAYTADARAADVIGHFRTIFASAGLPFNPNPNGTGTSIRGTTPECELLITLREETSGTHVLVSCAAQTEPAGALTAVTVQQNADTLSPSAPGRTASTSERFQETKRRFDEQHRRVLPEVQTDHGRRIDQTRGSDQPVYPNSSAKRPFYSDDAPPLIWPSWLVHDGNSRQPQPAERKAYGETYLESRYQTSAPMADLHQFYKRLVQANGYRIVTTRLTTSQTVKGNIAHPEPYGLVEACRSEDGTASGPRTCVKALFSGNRLDKPVTVSLQVRVRGSFGRR